MWKCPKCHEYRFDDVTKCRCSKFTIFDEEEEYSNIFALSFKDAALKYAEKSNTGGDYYLMDSVVEIEILGADGKKEKFAISAEQSIDYSAIKIN